MRLAEENRSLQVVLASEGDVSELRNKAGEIERMIEKFRSEQVRVASCWGGPLFVTIPRSSHPPSPGHTYG